MSLKPRIRPVEVFPVMIEGERTFCVRDPFHYIENTLFLNEFTFFVFSHLDGTRTLEDIRALVLEKTSVDVPPEEFAQFTDRLDEIFLLDNQRFADYLKELESVYTASDLRPMIHSRACYPDAPDAFRSELDKYYENAGLPAPAASHRETPDTAPQTTTGIIVPHIDPHRGGLAFALAYSRIIGRRPDLYVILGTGHAGGNNIYTAVPKSFATPLGNIPVDTTGIQSLRSSLGDSILLDNFIHRAEHSIEFQAAFLSHLWDGADMPPILPVMCSSFQEYITSGSDPSGEIPVALFIEALKIAIGGRDACFIASADLSHIGKRFGDEFPLHPALRDHIREEDLSMLESAAAHDPKAFFESVVHEHDPRRICGASSIYTMLSAMPKSSGELLIYEQSFEEHTESVVTFASMVFDTGSQAD